MLAASSQHLRLLSSLVMILSDDILTSGGGKELNLMTPIPADLLGHLEKTGVQSYLPLEYPSSSSSKATTGWATLSLALKKVYDALSPLDERTSIRLTIRDLGSADWGSPSAQVCRQSLKITRVILIPGNHTLHSCCPESDCVQACRRAYLHRARGLPCASFVSQKRGVGRNARMGCRCLDGVQGLRR